MWKRNRILVWGTLGLVGVWLFSPGRVYAAAHEECEICHGNRLGIGLAILTKKRKIAIINPNTGLPIERIEAICLSCHGDEEYKKQIQGITGEGFEEFPEAKLEGTTAVLEEMMLKPVDVGFRVIDLHESHPVGIVPKKVKLPKEARGFKGQEDQLTCLGCHDHHPSNKNYKYLRWPTDGGRDINAFCAHCHKDKMKPEDVIERKPRRRGFREF